jgi:ketosteroid isomerase-like protein
MTLDRAGFAEWLDRYVAAWKSYDRQAIGDLFSSDVEYRYHPQDEPLKGRDAIVADWLENRDDAGTYDAKYEPLAVDGDTCIATGWSRYFNADGSLKDEYSNIYLCRFDDEGRCREFTEWWIRNREFARAAAEASSVSPAGG